MDGMGTHSGRDQLMTAEPRHLAAGAPMRRARFAAWCVFVGMAVTSMTFQTYHAIAVGQMAWPLAALYGVAPLAISIGILEVAAAWGLWWAQVASYLIAGGAMYASASATGAVTQHAAAAHTELVFGLILDAAALLAIAFINHGPTAAQAVAAVIRREAELLGALRAEQAAREQDAIAHQAAVGALRDETGGALEAERAALGTKLSALSAQRDAEVSALRGELAGELESRDRALSDAEAALASARSETEAATARADRLERKLTGPATRSKPGTGRHGAAPGTGRGTAPDDELELESKALKLLATNLDMSGAELARKLGVSESYGRKLRRRLTMTGPSEAAPDRPEDRAGTVGEDR
jgi:hypothetical protein